MHILKRIYGASFIFSLSLALTAYINSSFLAERLGGDFVGILFSIAAFTTLVGLEILPRLVKRIGNANTILGLLAINVSAIALLIEGGEKSFILAGAFIIFNASNTLIWYCLDIFVEHFSKAKDVGTIRGTYLSITNLAWVGAPFIAGTILAHFDYNELYILVFVLILIVTLVLRLSLTTYRDAPYRSLSSIRTIKILFERPDLARITLINFTLQFFYAWMVIFTPLYLHTVLGINFTTIGLMFVCMLIPFVIIQYPLGRFADRISGEKELLGIGILIMGLTTLGFGWYAGTSVVILTAILFATRVGASITEIMSETYFFKKITDADSEIISLFRSTTPIAYLIAPLLGAFVLTNNSYGLLFTLLGIIVCMSLFLVFHLKDTR